MSEALEPIALTIPNALRISGLGRTRFYELLANGHIAAFKSGRRTLIRADSLKRYLDSCPAVDLRSVSKAA